VLGSNVLLSRGKHSKNCGLPLFLPTDSHSAPLIGLLYFKITWALAILLEHMHKKFEINRTKIKGGCQLGRKVQPQFQEWFASSINDNSTKKKDTSCGVHYFFLMCNFSEESLMFFVYNRSMRLLTRFCLFSRVFSFLSAYPLFPIFFAFYSSGMVSKSHSFNLGI